MEKNPEHEMETWDLWAFAGFGVRFLWHKPYFFREQVACVHVVDHLG